MHFRKTWFLVAAPLAVFAVAPLPATLKRAAPAALRSARLRGGFGGWRRARWAQPFKGITANGTLQPGLFSIRSTGIPTAPVRARREHVPRRADTGAAPAHPLSRRRRGVAEVGEPAPLLRQGVSFEEMKAAQRDAANAMLAASLSAKG